MCILQVVVAAILSYARLETTVPRGEWPSAANRDQSRLASLLFVEGIDSQRSHKRELLTQNVSIL